MSGEGSRGDSRDLAPHVEIWNKAAAELGIGWALTFAVRDDIETCQILSHPEERKHEVWLHPNVLNRPDFYKVDVLHELCHAKISETTDTAFSTIRFSRAAAAGWEGERKREFRQKAGQLELAWAHVDIWINDLRHKRWPELTKADITSFYDSVRRLIRLGDSENLGRPKNIVAIAMNMAEAARHLGKKSQPDPLPILNVYDMPTRKLIKELEGYFKKLPPLSGDREQDLALLEESVQTVAGIFKLPINPKLVQEEGQMVWEV